MKVGKVALALVVAVTGLAAIPVRADAAVAVITGADIGEQHSCAVTAANEIYCWGRNGNGDLGIGTNANSLTPVRVVGSQTWASVSLTEWSTCGLTTAGVAYCWGRNDAGQLGENFSVSESNVPVAVLGGHTFASISVGRQYACGLEASGDAYCWGLNGSGQLGDGTFTNRGTPTLVGGSHNWASISAGADVTCGVEVGGAGYCWGYNVFSATGIGANTGSQPNPTVVNGSHTWASISSGAGNTCGVTTAGAGYCWGDNVAGQLGDGTNTTSSSPVLVSGSYTWAQIEPGGGVSCGRTTANVIRCWGANGVNALGDGTTTNSNVPVLVATSRTFSFLSTGGAGGCALSSGALFCWGYNNYGQVGDGTLTNQSRPVAVTGLSGTYNYSTVIGVVDLSFNFTVVGRASACNGQSATGFQTSASSTSVVLGHLNVSVIGGGAQDLSVSTNAASGFTVYLKTTGTTPNAFRTSSGATVADVSGTHASPSASPAAGTAGFGYTTDDATIAFGSNKWAKLTTADDTVMVAGAGVTSKSTCTGFQATVASSTTAGSYITPIVYTAVPNF